MRLTKMIPPHEWAQLQNMGVEPPAEANWGRLVQRRRQKKRQQQGQPLMPTQVELSQLRTEFEFPRLQQGQAVSSPRLFEFPPRPPIAKAGGGICGRRHRRGVGTGDARHRAVAAGSTDASSDPAGAAAAAVIVAGSDGTTTAAMVAAAQQQHQRSQRLQGCSGGGARGRPQGEYQDRSRR